MNAILGDVLTDDQLHHFSKDKSLWPMLTREIRQLTVQELSEIGLIIISPYYDEKKQASIVICATALEKLILQAIDKKITVF